MVALCLLAVVGAAARADAVPWDALSPTEQRLLYTLQDRWEELPAARQESLLTGAQRWLQMSPEERSHARERLFEWQRMSPERQRQLRSRYQRFLALPPEQQRRLTDRYRWFQQLPAEHRERLRRRWNALPEEERSSIRQRLERQWRDPEVHPQGAPAAPGPDGGPRGRFDDRDLERLRELRERVWGMDPEERRQTWETLPEEDRRWLREHWQERAMDAPGRWRGGRGFGTATDDRHQWPEEVRRPRPGPTRSPAPVERRGD
jgi:hypothetical protein